MYTEDDFVYVDPESRSIVGKVEWTMDGAPKSYARKRTEGGDSKRGEELLPWGTLRSMRHAFLERKQDSDEKRKPLEEVFSGPLDEALLGF